MEDIIINSNNRRQVKSKKRVVDHGEVFTDHREVSAMLDLVKHETERIEATFLEPACGNGNFLIEILRRKLGEVQKKYKKSQLEFERNSVAAIGSIYGIDILEDNVKDCRERLYLTFNDQYTTLYKKLCREELRRTVEFILERNILWGNALNLKTVDNESPIVFSEWSFVTGSLIKRRDFEFEELTSENNLVSDLGMDSFIPKPIKEFPLAHFLKIGEAELC